MDEGSKILFIILKIKEKYEKSKFCLSYIHIRFDFGLFLKAFLLDFTEGYKRNLNKRLNFNIMKNVIKNFKNKQLYCFYVLKLLIKIYFTKMQISICAFYLKIIH